MFSCVGDRFVFVALIVGHSVGVRSDGFVGSGAQFCTVVVDVADRCCAAVCPVADCGAHSDFGLGVWCCAHDLVMNAAVTHCVSPYRKCYGRYVHLMRGRVCPCLGRAPLQILGQSWEMTGVMNWREGELLAAEHMRLLGFSDAVATPVGADKGIDVVSDGAVAQVKHFSSSPVGSPDVQRLRGAGHAADHVLFYSLSGFTSSAVEVADVSGVVLFQYSAEYVVEPRNGLAERLLSRGNVPVRLGRSTAERQKFFDSFAEYGQGTLDLFGEVGMQLAKLLEGGIEGMPTAQRAALDEVLPRLGEAGEIVAVMKGNEVVFSEAVTMLARLEYLTTLMGCAANVDVDECRRVATAKRRASGFIPAVEQKSP